MREKTVLTEDELKEQRRAQKRSRRERGLCNECPMKALFGRRYCQTCIDRYRARSKLRRALGTTPPPPTPTERRRSKVRRRKLGLCNDCAAPADQSQSRCAQCAERHRLRERLAQKYGRPDYLAHLHEELPVWQRALLARGQRFVLKARRAS
jgi:predicted amidophosphoribosyltransferase